MSQTVTSMTVPRTVIAVEQRRPTRRGSTFYVGMSGLLLLIVFVGFSRTFYLRSYFNVPDIPASLVAHGVAMTAWFVGVFLQTTLIRVRRVEIHRSVGWMLCVAGVAVVASGLFVTLNFVPRMRALGRDIEADIAGLSSVVWTDLVALVVFSVFLAAAVAFRRRPLLHKRLMLLASISVISPAMARMWTILFGIRGPERDLVSLGALVVLLLMLVVHDWISTRRVHAVTVLGAMFFIGVRILGGFVVAGSDFGRSVVRGL